MSIERVDVTIEVVSIETVSIEEVEIWAPAGGPEKA